MSTKLPILNAPRFTDKLPSTGENFTYRPFLVKEEKYIQLTKNSDDMTVIHESLKSLISSCTDIKSVERMSTFDIEYVFLRLREKSIGDIIELKMRHVNETDCTHVEDVLMDLKKIRIQNYESHTDTILLDQETNIRLKMKYPKYNDAAMISNNDEFESLLNILISCTEVVTQGDDAFMMKDFSMDEKREFFLNFGLSHMEKVKTFFETMPKVCYDLEWTCSKCGEKETHTIEGVQSFLS